MILMKHTVHLIGLGLLLLLTVSSLADANPPTTQSVVDGLIAHLEKLRNVTIRYQVTIKSNPVGILVPTTRASPSDYDGRIPRQPPIVIPEEQYDRTFRFLDGWWALDSKLTSEDSPRFVDRHIIEVSRSDRHEIFAARQRDEDGSGNIGDVPLIEFPGSLDNVIGLRLPNSTEWETADSLKQLKVIAVLSKGDNIELDSNTSFGEGFRLMLQPQLDYSIVSWASEPPSGIGYRISADCSDFREIQKCQLPFQVVWTVLQQPKTGPSIQATSATIKVITYVLNDPSNDRQTFFLRWPKGVPVLDTRVSKSVKTTEAGQILTDETLAKIYEDQDRAHAELLDRTRRRMEKVLSSTNPSTRQ